MKKDNKLGSLETKKRRAEEHRQKMDARREMYLFNNKEKYQPDEWIYANLSKNHEFFGDTPTEHEQRKNSS